MTSLNSSLFLRSWVEISSRALLNNVKKIQELAPYSKLLAIVKANGYGHGLKEVSQIIAPSTAAFGVTSLEEALSLRTLQKREKKDIFILSPSLREEYKEIGTSGFIPVISSYEEALLFCQTNPSQSRINLKIDTGMGRVGIDHREAPALIEKISKLGVSIVSFSTHLAAADSNEEYTREQLSRFERLIAYFKKIAPQAQYHLLNSAGILGFPSCAYDLVRPGLLLYGISPRKEGSSLFTPALSWKTKIVLIKELQKGDFVSYGQTYQAPYNQKIALLSTGYADGYPRSLSLKNHYVLIHGKKAPLLGRVTMDLIIVDISLIPETTLESEVVLLGTQGEEEITPSFLAEQAGLIPWELLTGISQRVHRLYKEN